MTLWCSESVFIDTDVGVVIGSVYIDSPKTVGDSMTKMRLYSLHYRVWSNIVEISSMHDTAILRCVCL